MESKKLTEVCSPKQWKTISQAEMLPEGYPVYGANGIIGYYNEYNHEDPTVLITCRGATCGTLNISKPFSYVNGNAMALDNVIDGVDEKYLYYYLQSRGLTDIISGSAQPQITIQNLTKVIVSYPSVEQQKRIVSMLDKADEIRTKKKQANEKLDEFLNSKFFEIFGNLETNTNGWKVEKLEDISYKITDGVHSKPVYTDSGIPFVSVKDITTKKLLLNDCKFISNEAHIKYSKRCKPEYEDVLYTKVGATYGRACVVDTQEEFSLYVSVALIKPKKNIINPYFLKAVLNTDSIKKQADKRIKGIGVPDLHLIEIKNFIIPVPPMVEQMKFLKIVEKVEEQKQRNEKIIEQMDNLFNSLSQKAFKGEL